MVRQLTDRRVFEQLLEAENLTRAEIAARTGISKPTISESVRRLIDVGLVGESGRQLNGRGRAGTYCHVRTDTAAAMAVSVGPDGVVVDTFDLKDRPLAHVERPVPTPVDGRQLEPVLLDAVHAAVQSTPGTIRSCVVSVAGPVDRRTGRLVEIPHAPFLVGEFAPGEVLRGIAPVIEVDNDVNWAALAEHRHGNATDLDDFVLYYLGAGIGGAIMIGGSLIGGAHGMAGELAHVRTSGPADRSLTLIECFAAWDLLVPGSDAIDVPRVRRVLEGRTLPDRRRSTEIAGAVAGAIESVTALLDPNGVLLGGPWGDTPGLLELVADQLAAAANPAPDLRPISLTEAPYRDGARIRAVALARRAVAEAF
jgi:DNA-binding Lrp family transcriptional regulator